MIDVVKKLLRRLSARLGREIIDERTGGSLGRAFCLATPWGVWMIGLPDAVRMVFLPEKTTRYTKHRIGFATHEVPDYESLGDWGVVHADSLLWVVLVHQQPGPVRELLGYWRSLGYPAERILLAHAGREEDFRTLDVPNKVFVRDQEIRTIHHPLQRQSYHGVFREVSAWMKGRDFSGVALVEYDHLPLVPDWGEKMCDLMEHESADVLCHHLTRVDDTNSPHYLHHLQDPCFREIWKPFSQREQKGVFLNAVMTGSLWKRSAFEAVAVRREPFPVYLELYLPSLAHHLGCRVRRSSRQDEFVQVIPLQEPFSKSWIAKGAWSIHQVKSLTGFSGNSR
jgi:hypothetical protein